MIAAAIEAAPALMAGCELSMDRSPYRSDQFGMQAVATVERNETRKAR
jgi:hypothetical protein